MYSLAPQMCVFGEICVLLPLFRKAPPGGWICGIAKRLFNRLDRLTATTTTTTSWRWGRWELVVSSNCHCGTSVMAKPPPFPPPIVWSQAVGLCYGSINRERRASATGLVQRWWLVIDLKWFSGVLEVWWSCCEGWRIWSMLWGIYHIASFSYLEREKEVFIRNWYGIYILINLFLINNCVIYNFHRFHPNFPIKTV